MAGAQDHCADLREILARQTARPHVLFDDPAHHVVARRFLLPADEAHEVARQVARLLLGLRRRLQESVAADGALDDELVVLVRRADEIAHHERRKRNREGSDQIGGLRLRRQLVDQPVRDGGDPRAQRRDALGAEFPGEHAPVVIVARIVHADERALLLVDDDARRGHRREPGIGELAAEARIGHHGAHVLVAREQPRATPVPQRHGTDRLRGARLRVLRRRLQRIGAAEREARRMREVVRHERDVTG